MRPCVLCHLGLWLSTSPCKTEGSWVLRALPLCAAQAEKRQAEAEAHAQLLERCRELEGELLASQVWRVRLQGGPGGHRE